LSLGFDKFTMPLVGGFDGLNITEAEAFNNTRALEGKSSLTSYAVYSAKKAFNTVADAEVVESNMMTIPGVYASNIQDHMIRICENRADSLAIIDLKGDYTPTPENSANAVSRKGDVDTTINNLNDRALNTSYAAAYYPWVRISDSETGGTLWVPPSVPAIGTLSSAQRRSELWFAPAGFTRGGLTEGAAGVPVNSVAQRLRQKDRDDLYAANINPIATFPAEGIVIFGQKTLQVTPSALDRINVSRLMIYVKREISFIASRLLFEQNVQATWDRFTGQVSPFLDSIVARQGLTDYRVILDETTTTPDLVDRNTIYAKIFLKPARAVEFIAIDFVITRSGAAFED
jgi:phage tail sheath protein FI